MLPKAIAFNASSAIPVAFHASFSRPVTMEPTQGILATITAATVWRYAPIANLTLLDALPPAARERETKKAADTFASTGRNVFVHYATPILEERRNRLLASGLRKKKYPKTAPQLWQSIGHDEEFYWNEVVRSLRQGMKQGVLSPKGCLIHGGRAGEREGYVYHAAVAVAAYLELPAPIEKEIGEDVVITCSGDSKEEVMPKLTKVDITAIASDATSTAKIAAKDDQEMEKTHDVAVAVVTSSGETKTDDVSSKLEQIDITTTGDISSTSSTVGGNELLDSLPSLFIYDQTMLYSHFAHYDYELIRKAEGKHQTAMLRQFADLFDKTGKILFYYYVVPRLCKETYPPTAGQTVTGQAAKIWRFLPGVVKNEWRVASAGAKKRLGDGDIGGLEVLELGSLDPEVMRLHELARSKDAEAL